MVDDDFLVEVIGHATLRVQHGGRTLLTDPWLVGPIGCDSAFHFPPLVHDLATLAAETDAIYISHVHKDHFSRPTLEHFSRDIPIYIGDYRGKRFRDDVRALGFRVVEAPFQQAVPVEGLGIEIVVLEHDYDETAAFDSSIVIRTPECTVFENNDCFMKPEKYRWVRDHFRVDYAFLGYSPASFYPMSFELDEQEKARLLADAAERRYGDFVDAARLLAPRLAIPFASGARFLLASELWKNVSFNSASEALLRLQTVGLPGAVLGPGDRIASDGSIRRVSPVLSRADELAAIAAHAEQVQASIVALQQQVPPARADVVERFRDYILGLWRNEKDAYPEVRRNVIAYVLEGEKERRFYFDFSRPDDQIFQWGEPPRYDMRYTYPSRYLQRRLDGVIDWDELHFTGSVSVHQVTYAREFYRMLRADMLDPA